MGSSYKGTRPSLGFVLDKRFAANHNGSSVFCSEMLTEYATRSSINFDTEHGSILSKTSCENDKIQLKMGMGSFVFVNLAPHVGHLFGSSDTLLGP